MLLAPIRFKKNSTECQEVNETSKICDKQQNAQSVSENEKTSSNLGSGFTDLESDLNDLDTVSSKQNTDATGSISESTCLDTKETLAFTTDRNDVEIQRKKLLKAVDNDNKNNNMAGSNKNTNSYKKDTFSKEFFQEKIDGFMPIDPNKNLFREFLEESKKKIKAS